VGEYFDMPINTYSSGMRARLSFGLSMVFDFDVYLVDELTSVGDAIFRTKAKLAFERIRQRASLIFVSHNFETLRESCDSALFLRDGIVDFYKNIDEGIKAYNQYIKERHNSEPAKNPNRILARKRALKKGRQKSKHLPQAPPEPSDS
jgi:capsular polysaccharide transport system ATP-binding protein